MENGCLSPVTKYMLHVYLLLMIPHFTKTYWCVLKQGKAVQFQYKRGYLQLFLLESS